MSGAVTFKMGSSGKKIIPSGQRPNITRYEKIMQAPLTSNGELRFQLNEDTSE